MTAVSMAVVTQPSAAADAPGLVRLHIDADRTGAKAAGVAIEQGIRTALDEVDGRLGGLRVEVVVRDHRGNTRRSKRHLEAYLADDRALAVFCGLHSPPVLTHRDFINEKGILLLDPWAAAGPITRYPSRENWIFRLSVDDTKAGYVIARYAVRQRGFRKPALLLENTGWGRSNEATMTAALADLGVTPAALRWFNWGLGRSGARILLHEIQRAGADVILLVANAAEGKTLAHVMCELPAAQRVPICSHWGITGGDFPQVIDTQLRERLDLVFIQTRFSFLKKPADPLAEAVFARAQELFPDVLDDPRDIRAPAGFAHAYDLTRLLIAAVKDVGLTENIVADRRRLRAALEKLETPVRGLVKTYVRPFGVFDEAHPDAHEALSIDDLTMARYGQHGEILLAPAGGDDR